MIVQCFAVVDHPPVIDLTDDVEVIDLTAPPMLIPMVEMMEDSDSDGDAELDDEESDWEEDWNSDDDDVGDEDWTPTPLAETTV